VRGCDHRTSMPRREAWKSYSASWHRFVPRAPGAHDGARGLRILPRELMAWCEANRVEYLLGLAKNERLKAEIAQEMGEAKAQYQQTGRAAGCSKSSSTRHGRVGAVRAGWWPRPSIWRKERTRDSW